MAGTTRKIDDDARQILIKVGKYLLDNPDIRFGQALFNLGIVQFANQAHPELANHQLRDIYNDTDEAINKRIIKV